MKPNFYMVLPSTSSKKYFPENSQSEFTTQLPTPIELDGRWQVGLAEISFPKVTFFNIKTNISFGLISWTIGVETDHINHPMIHPVTNKLIKATIPSGNYTNEGFVEAVNKGIRYIWKKQMMFDKANDSPKFLYETETQKVSFICPHISARDGIFRHWRTWTKFMLQPANEIDSIVYSYLGYNNAANFRRQLDDPKDQSNTKSNAPEPLNFTQDHPGSGLLYVCSNIIAPMIVGNNLLPLLRSIPITLSDSLLVTERFVNPYYVSLHTNRVESVHMFLCDDIGNKLNFGPGQVQVTLHFRECNKA